MRKNSCHRNGVSRYRGTLSHPDVGTPFSNENFNFGSLCAQVGNDGHSLAWKINICHFHMHDNWNFQQASQTIAIACADTIVDQGGLFLLWQSLKWQKIAICKCKKVLTSYLENFWASSFKPQRKTKWQKKFHICKWISFHISTFQIVEEMLFDMESLHSNQKFKLWEIVL